MNTTQASNNMMTNDGGKSYRAPVLKNGLHISQQLNLTSPTHGAIMGSLPNSTKNQITNVQNKFNNRDVSPKAVLNNSLGNSGSVVSTTQVNQGHQAQRGFQPQPHNARVQSLDVSQ